MPEVLGDDHQGHTVHYGMARPGMPQPVKAQRWSDAAAFAGIFHWLFLMIFLPDPAVILREHRRVACFAGSNGPEKGYTLFCQHNVPWLAGFGLPNRDGTAVRIEVDHSE